VFSPNLLSLVDDARVLENDAAQIEPQAYAKVSQEEN
jgi:hypothetical protein